MPNRWRLATLTETFEVVHHSAATDVHARRELPFELRAALGRCVETPGGQLTLREMYQSIYGLPALRFADGPRREDLRRMVIPALERAFDRGLLLVVAAPRRHATGTVVHRDERDEAPREEPTQRALTWIEIELVDEDDQPVAGQRYELVLPDGSVRSGTLDRYGFARIDGIEEGNCTVTFPTLDQSAWEAA